jgi:hypothetical protein
MGEHVALPFTDELATEVWMIEHAPLLSARAWAEGNVDLPSGLWPRPLAFRRHLLGDVYRLRPDALRPLKDRFSSPKCGSGSRSAGCDLAETLACLVMPQTPDKELAWAVRPGVTSGLGRLLKLAEREDCRLRQPRKLLGR